MEEFITTGLSNTTNHHFENGEEVWPCVYGVSHGNSYDWFHPICLHGKADLVRRYPGEKDRAIVAFCAECGKGFNVGLTTLAP